MFSPEGGLAASGVEGDVVESLCQKKHVTLSRYIVPEHTCLRADAEID